MDFRSCEYVVTDRGNSYECARERFCGVTSSERCFTDSAIVFFSASLLSDRGASERKGAWVGFGIGLCNFM